MKNKKLYFGFVAFLLLMIVWLLEVNMQERGIALGSVVLAGEDIPNEWYDIIASDINNASLKLEVDDVQVTFANQGLYMESNLDVMIPADIFTDTFKCAINSYTKDKIELQKSNVVVEIQPHSSYVKIGGVSMYLPNAMKVTEQAVYINAEVLECAFGYEYTWDSKSNTVCLADTKKEESILPTKYSYVRTDRMPLIKNQGAFSTCWAFAALSALETSVKPQESIIFSVDNMVGNNGYSSSLTEGGDYNRAIAYLTSWRGPVFESDDIYGDGKVNKNAQPVKHVQEVQIIESKNLEAIKRNVFLYGGVESSLYTSMNSAGEQSMYYNDKKNAYCYIGTKKPNHDVVIIGWDDNYPRGNFNTSLDGDGAFICVNSWGEEFGDDGVFYVSYYDSNIGIHNVVYTGVEDADNYDNIYQSDICGRIGQLGYDEETAFFANVYQARSNEMLRAVGFYATDKNTSYSIYVVKDFQNEDSFGSKELLQEGSFANEGFYTVKLNQAVQMEAGKNMQ